MKFRSIAPAALVVVGLFGLLVMGCSNQSDSAVNSLPVNPGLATYGDNVDEDYPFTDDVTLPGTSNELTGDDHPYGYDVIDPQNKYGHKDTVVVTVNDVGD